MKSTLTPRDVIISKNVMTSPIFGTLWRVYSSKKSPQAISGSAAFLEPEIKTSPEVCCGQWIVSILSIISIRIGVKSVADSSKRLDSDMSIDFFSKIFDMRIYGSIVQIVIIAHHIVHNIFSFYDIMCIFDAVF